MNIPIVLGMLVSTSVCLCGSPIVPQKLMCADTANGWGFLAVDEPELQCWCKLCEPQRKVGASARWLSLHLMESGGGLRTE